MNQDITDSNCVTRQCPRCSKDTKLHSYCNDCVVELEAKGVSIDTLWDIEEDAYIVHGLAKMASERK